MYISHSEYFVIAAYPGKHYRVPQPVWKREPYGDCGAGHIGDAGQHGGGGGVYKDKGQKTFVSVIDVRCMRNYNKSIIM